MEDKTLVEAIEIAKNRIDRIQTAKDKDFNQIAINIFNVREFEECLKKYYQNEYI